MMMGDLPNGRFFATQLDYCVAIEALGLIKFELKRIKKERKKEGLTSVSPSRDDVGDALGIQKETNYASHVESTNRDPEERRTRCRVKIQNTYRGRGRSKGEKVSLKRD